MTSHLVRAAALAIATCATASVLAIAQDGAAPPSAATMLNLADTATRGEQPYPANVRPQAHYPQQRRSVVHHYPYPYPAYYHGESQAGFRNPEGRGRYAEFYEPEDLAARPYMGFGFGVGGFGGFW